MWYKQYVVVFLQTFLYILKKLKSGRKEYCVQDVKNYVQHSGTKCHINKCMAKDKMVFDLYWQLQQPEGDILKENTASRTCFKNITHHTVCLHKLLFHTRKLFKQTQPHVHTYLHKTITPVHTIYTHVLNYNVAVFLGFFH